MRSLASGIAAIFLVGNCWCHADGRIIGAAVIPHGDFAYDPSVANFTHGTRELHAASLRAGRFVEAELKPDVIFITTPHGLELNDDFLIYENSQDKGDAPVGDVPHSSSYTVHMAARTDTTLASFLRSRLQSLGYHVAGLQGFSDSQPLPISWGEILPLTYINASAMQSGRLLPPVVILSIPFRRFNHSVQMVPEMLRLGGEIAELLDTSERHVAWVVSADLAHTHLSSGPYGYCPCAKPFDAAVGRWLQSLQMDELVKEAANQQTRGAASCGFTGLVLLQGCVNSFPQGSWSSELLANEAPTYYGMAVAEMRRQLSTSVHI